MDVWTRYWARLADPARAVVADATGIDAGTTLLDVGCGSGEFARLAADRGATVSGLDLAAQMVARARAAVPAADLRVGDMTALPWPDATFDVVTAFNAFQFADDPGAPLLEAARVLRPGGRIAVCNWGPLELQQNNTINDALKRLLPAVPPARTITLSPPGTLETLVEAAGLHLLAAADVEVPWVVADESTLIAAVQLNVVRLGIAEHADAHTIDDTIRSAAAPFRRHDGSYRFENRWHYVVAGTASHEPA